MIIRILFYKLIVAGGAQVFTAVMGKQVHVAFGNVGDIGTKNSSSGRFP
jgi:hypothetical protein